jgi:nitrite reductase (NADH) small subunit
MTATHVAAVSDIPPGSAREVTVGERVVALFNVEGTIYALDGLCRHAGGPLGNGTLQGEVVTCPWHGWQYNVKSGQHCLTPRILQDRFDVEVRGDDVYVLLNDPTPAP